MLSSAKSHKACDEMTKEDVTAMILSAKKKAGLTWEEIANKIGMSPVWTHSASMGMNAFPAEKAKLMVKVMGLPQEAESLLVESPTKIWEQAVPTDPCIYRFYEIVGVYGPTLKALIQEKFGDGIMSAIDFDMTVTRVESPKGDRVKVEMSGKYLGYNSW
jgi:cyanate lyase